MDNLTKEQRSYTMSQVRSKNTAQERLVFFELRKRGVYFQKHYSKVSGNPDIAFPSKKIAVFIDSDFWHGWRYPSWSHKLTSDFWRNKIERNRKRDKEVTRRLRKDGWSVLRLWEHQIKKDPVKSLDKIIQATNKNSLVISEKI